MFVLCGFTFANAHKSLSKTVYSELEDDQYLLLVTIGEDSKIRLTIQDEDKLDKVESVSDINSLTDFLTKLSRKKEIRKPWIMIKANQTLKYGLVVDYIKKIRSVSDNRIRIDLYRKDRYLYTPQELSEDELANIKPNPLTLIVGVTADGKVSLNNFKSGSLNNLSSLEKKLKQIFEDRENNGVFRENTNETIKDVYLKASRSLQFSEVIKVAKAIDTGEAYPIILQIEDLN